MKTRCEDVIDLYLYGWMVKRNPADTCWPTYEQLGIERTISFDIGLYSNQPVCDIGRGANSK